jgi:DNA polymerase III delta prime subunit
MIGQVNLINKLKSYTIDNFPQTLLITGEKGSGKHSLVREVISPHLKLDIIDITDNISFEYILQIQLRVIPSIYLIEVSSLTEKEQNIILKLIEEPLSGSYLILLSNSKFDILPTIINRCVEYNMEKYSKEELSSFASYTKEETINFAMNVCTAPGQLLITNENTMDDIKDTTKKMATVLKDKSFYFTIFISKKIDYKDNSGKFDITVFLNSLLYFLFEEYKDNKNEKALAIYYKTIEYKNRLQNQKLNRETLIQNFLTTIWKIARSI